MAAIGHFPRPYIRNWLLPDSPDPPKGFKWEHIPRGANAVIHAIQRAGDCYEYILDVINREAYRRGLAGYADCDEIAGAIPDHLTIDGHIQVERGYQAGRAWRENYLRPSGYTTFDREIADVFRSHFETSKTKHWRGTYHAAAAMVATSPQYFSRWLNRVQIGRRRGRKYERHRWRATVEISKRDIENLIWRQESHLRDDLAPRVPVATPRGALRSFLARGIRMGGRAAREAWHFATAARSGGTLIQQQGLESRKIAEKLGIREKPPP